MSINVEIFNLFDVNKLLKQKSTDYQNRLTLKLHNKFIVNQYIFDINRKQPTMHYYFLSMNQFIKCYSLFETLVESMPHYDEFIVYRKGDLLYIENIPPSISSLIK